MKVIIYKGKLSEIIEEMKRDLENEKDMASDTKQEG